MTMLETVTSDAVFDVCDSTAGGLPVATVDQQSGDHGETNSALDPAPRDGHGCWPTARVDPTADFTGVTSIFGFGSLVCGVAITRLCLHPLSR
jgi:hypothetical protein